MHLSKMLTRAASLYPDNVAVVGNGRRLTYRALATRVNRVAAALSRRGIGVGDRVSILDHNSCEFLEAYFAVAELGAVSVPLNTRLHATELAFVLEDSGARVVIANAGFAKLLDEALSDAGGVEGVIWIGGERAEAGGRWTEQYESIAAAEVERADMDAHDPEAIAHLYYTSGTTSDPKGVILTHRNVAVHALGAIAELGLRETDVWGHLAPMFHLADAWAVFAITLVGGRHVVSGAFDAVAACAAIEEHRITVTNLVPTMLNAIIRLPEGEEADLSSIRLIMSGGAPISPDLVRRVSDRFGGEYVQTYGMTETSPYLTMSLLKEKLVRASNERQLEYRAKTGRPFLPVELMVARPDGREVRRDEKEVGEIRVRGDTISPGYWNRPDADREAFVDGWLTTGDLAVIDAEGYVTIVDRAKDTIITGGENVHSVEVEHVLASHPAVVEVAVFGTPDDHWGEVVTAAVVRQAGSSLSEYEVVAFGRERLSGFKVPRRVLFLESLPKTGSGKISKKELRRRCAS